MWTCFEQMKFSSFIERSRSIQSFNTLESPSCLLYSSSSSHIDRTRTEREREKKTKDVVDDDDQTFLNTFLIPSSDEQCRRMCLFARSMTCFSSNASCQISLFLFCQSDRFESHLTIDRMNLQCLWTFDLFVTLLINVCRVQDRHTHTSRSFFFPPHSHQELQLLQLTRVCAAGGTNRRTISDHCWRHRCGVWCRSLFLLRFFPLAFDGCDWFAFSRSLFSFDTHTRTHTLILFSTGKWKRRKPLVFHRDDDDDDDKHRLLLHWSQCNLSSFILGIVNDFKFNSVQWHVEERKTRKSWEY